MSAPHYKGKDAVTGYWVYGPVYANESGYYIDDIEAGLVRVEPDSVEITEKDDVSIPRTTNDSAEKLSL